MVRALLDGSKTQTRRSMKPRPEFEESLAWPKTPWQTMVSSPHKFFDCRYGQPGDQLYVREAWAQPTSLDPGPTFYRADYPACVPPQFSNVPPVEAIKWKPGIHMFRSQSRIQLEVVDVRQQWLQMISGADALAEGVRIPCSENGSPLLRITGRIKPDQVNSKNIHEWGVDEYARFEYANLWETINGRGSWDFNPVVWVIEFKKVTP